MAQKIIWTGAEVKAYVDNHVGDVSTDLTGLTAQVNTNKTDITNLKSKDSTHDSKIASLESKVNTVEALATGRSSAKYYATITAANTAISAMANNEMRVGDNIYIGETQVPDWYVAEILTTKGAQTIPAKGSNFADSYNVGFYKLAQLETEKVDLSAYETAETAGGKYALKTDALKNVTYTKSNHTLGQTTDSGSSSNISTDIAAYSEVPNSGSLDSGNLLNIKHGNTSLFTISLSGLSISDASNTVAGKVKLNKTAQYTSTHQATPDDVAAITGGYLKAWVVPYVNGIKSTIETTANGKYATKSELSTTNDNVTANLNAIQAIQNSSITISVSDGLTIGGILTLTIPD